MLHIYLQHVLEGIATVIISKLAGFLFTSEAYFYGNQMVLITLLMVTDVTCNTEENCIEPLFLLLCTHLDYGIFLTNTQIKIVKEQFTEREFFSLQTLKK